MKTPQELDEALSPSLHPSHMFSLISLLTSLPTK